MRHCPYCNSLLADGEVHKDHNWCLRALDRRLARLEAAADFNRDRGPG